MDVTALEPGALAAPLAELKAYLRIAIGDEDALLAGFLRSAAALCEQFVGQWLIAREAEEVIAVPDRTPMPWRRLGARPVGAILSVTGMPGEGAAFALAADAYAVDIDGNGDGWVKVGAPGAATRIKVRYRAGLAEAMNGLPEPIRQGIVRLAAEHYARRDGNGGDGDPPAAVAALWRPYRRMRLS